MSRFTTNILVVLNHSVEHMLKQVKKGFFYLPVIFFWLTIMFFYVGHLSTDEGFKFNKVSQAIDEGWQLLEPVFRLSLCITLILCVFQLAIGLFRRNSARAPLNKEE
ncbi:hypothetical protein [Arsenophonus sp.]|uniref:hypothetical protein n=1 Tax=Arsenophonus sp. TaxID=1872640 RepID=UPI00286735B3|nr:hypothetical protein [Arsenophonus sp.]MDR5610301.1 hypothetical protein [Arsenophonus sp.]MDR5614117.1 hypothetical protein [Arsenophonus sp.]